MHLNDAPLNWTNTYTLLLSSYFHETSQNARASCGFPGERMPVLSAEVCDLFLLPGLLLASQPPVCSGLSWHYYEQPGAVLILGHGT